MLFRRFWISSTFSYLLIVGSVSSLRRRMESAQYLASRLLACDCSQEKLVLEASNGRLISGYRAH